MKKSVKSLLTLLLLLGVTLEMKAADAYLPTSQTTNGVLGKSEMPSNYNPAPNASSEESGEPVMPSAVTLSPGYYLVGNFFSKWNVGGDVNPGGDREVIDYKNHVYFKFEQQKDKSFTYSIPACLTAHAQILAVADDGSMMVYGPGSVFGLHGAKSGTAVPETNGAVGTPTATALVGSTTIAEDNNYWDLVTRNDNVIDDDGMYTFSFTLDDSGNPSDWQVKHDATTRVSYILGDVEGATAQPLFDKRKSGGDTGEYSDNNVASLYFNGRNNYWCIGYVVNNLNRDNAKEQNEQAIKATADIHVTKSVNANHNNSSGTHDKLFFLGNGGYSYNTSDNRNKVWPNQKPFTLHLFGIKRVVFNANRGYNDLAKLDGSYGMSAEIELKGGDSNNADFTINTMSMIGDAVEGTYDAKTGSWNYASKAGDMVYDANERCFSLTISTVDEKYAHSHFRFVANHDAAQNWGETDDNINNNAGFARSTYNGADDDNYTCMAGDANDVQFRSMAREADTDFGSESLYRKDILWNRPAGIWTIRFYPERDLDGNDISRYTISGTKYIHLPFTYRVDKFIRTYSNSVAMEPADDKVKVYAAYKYEPPKEVKDLYSQGKVYLRELHYVPANMGVVLVGQVPADGTYKDGEKLDFSLKERTADFADKNEDLWIKAEQYAVAGDQWNNYLIPTVQAIDNLGNADTDENGTIAHRYFGLGNFHSTKYYKETQTGDDYIGFFRLTENGRSGANKAYLSIPANTVVDDGVGATYGYINYNGQLLGNVADTNNNQSLAKMAVIFDDEDNGGTTTAVREVKMDTADADASFYTLQGIKVSRPVKGVYIHNGKKFIK